MCFRMRAKGWRIRRIDAKMTLSRATRAMQSPTVMLDEAPAVPERPPIDDEEQEPTVELTAPLAAGIGELLDQIA